MMLIHFCITAAFGIYPSNIPIMSARRACFHPQATENPACHVCWLSLCADHLQGAPIYKNAYNMTAGMAGHAKDNPVYKLSATHVYPVISPLADPLLNKAQPYVDTVFEQLKPIAASA